MLQFDWVGFIQYDCAFMLFRIGKMAYSTVSIIDINGQIILRCPPTHIIIFVFIRNTLEAFYLSEQDYSSVIARATCINILEYEILFLVSTHFDGPFAHMPTHIYIYGYIAQINKKLQKPNIIRSMN